MDMDALAQALCEDCRNRRLRVNGIVREGVPLTNRQLDQLHQEFDTLYGGARAVHVPEMEHFFHNMARYARCLRNIQESGKEVDRQDWQRLLADIEKWVRCNGDSSCCFTHRNNENTALIGKHAGHG